MLHSKDLDSPNALSIDFVENKLYWGDGDLRTVWYSELNGSNVKVGYCIYSMTLFQSVKLIVYTLWCNFTSTDLEVGFYCVISTFCFQSDLVAIKCLDCLVRHVVCFKHGLLQL